MMTDNKTQRLGPIELDANGEARGDGWRVIDEGTCLQIDGSDGAPWNFRGRSVSLAKGIDRALASTINPVALADLRRWCEQVGWFRGEQPDTITCGPLRLEWSRGAKRWLAGRSLWVVNGYGRFDGYANVDGGVQGRLLASGPSPAEAAQALAAAIEASTDPAVVRFREEHWIDGGRRVDGFVIDDLDPDAYDRAIRDCGDHLRRDHDRQRGERTLRDAAIPCQGPVHAQLHGALAREGWFPLEAERQIAAACEEFFRFEWWVRSHKTGRDRGYAYQHRDANGGLGRTIGERP